MKNKIWTILGLLMSFAIFKGLEEIHRRKMIKDSMNDLKNQLLNNPYYKKQREEMGL